MLIKKHFLKQKKDICPFYLFIFRINLTYGANFPNPSFEVNASKVEQQLEQSKCTKF
ncbi:hypothetical protein PB1_04115 [Bacillus methanolicus PB1]|uniref:Uncharacterized protein n=1 Tax=Bacillus methanolicus PB1 TaxID=997296 RepID=I3E6H2_BACMT|nr:hypothetical protein PB1_04115 [Bacillus methanolicus PB1]